MSAGLRRGLLAVAIVTSGLLSADPALAAADPTPPPAGVFGMVSDRRGNVDEMVALLEDRRTRGVSYNLLWKTIEPEKDRFDWSPIESSLALARKHGKCLNIRVIGGAWGIPDWVYREAKPYYFVDKNPHHRSEGEILRNVTPWDPHYVARWKVFITELAKKIDAKPSVCIVYMTGPAKTSGEMHLPREKDLRRGQDPASPHTTWVALGGGRDSIFGSWEVILRHYAASFRSKYLGLGSALILGDRELHAKILKVAMDSIGDRFCLQGNWVSGKASYEDRLSNPGTARKGNAFQLQTFKTLRSRGGCIGAQALGTQETRMGDFDEFVRNVILIDASYVELQDAYFRGGAQAKAATQLFEHFERGRPAKSPAPASEPAAPPDAPKRGRKRMNREGGGS